MHFNVAAGTIEEVVREQIENVVYSLFAWAEGSFDFELQESVEVSDAIRLDPLQFMLDQGLNPQFLAMEGSRIIDEMRHRPERTMPAPVSAPKASPHDDVDDFAFHLVENSAPAAQAAPPIPAMQKPVSPVDKPAAAAARCVSLYGEDQHRG